jgi:hypothetical protein
MAARLDWRRTTFDLEISQAGISPRCHSRSSIFVASRQREIMLLMEIPVQKMMSFPTSYRQQLLSTLGI